MGSGELTSSMVSVHKSLIAGLIGPPKVVFLDTPAGFQLNADDISQRAVDYFRTRIGQEMTVVSFKSAEKTNPFEAEKAFQGLRKANYILIGPGSPTYAVRQWRQSPVPDILTDRINAGGCLVAASAAALTVGRSTLPVYEIYKVGEDLHWVEGMDILGRFGLDLVVIPHWNNAEGGTHDTRFCYMGEPRFEALAALLPNDVGILGLDEHTACLVDFAAEEALIQGIGQVIFRRGTNELRFEKGDRFGLDVLRGGPVRKQKLEKSTPIKSSEAAPAAGEASFWDRIHEIEDSFKTGMETGEPRQITNALLDLDRTIWEAKRDLESEEFISQAREILREWVVLVGLRLESSPKDREECLSPLVEALLALRREWRKTRRWEAADALRLVLAQAGVVVEDTRDGSRWRLKS